MGHEDDRRYRIAASRDPRFDGCFVMGVRTTGIYCRPSCPARTPKRDNVEFFAAAAGAQVAGYRACKRCRPDASPGSPDWNGRSDVAARAMRLIADGMLDRDGVPALARALGYSERHLHRVLVAEVGAGPLSIARSQRAQNARILVETTTMPMVDVAFAAGFASLRQFNDTVRAVFDASPTELRAQAVRRGRAVAPVTGGTGSDAADRWSAPTDAAVTITLRLAHRAPFAAGPLWAFLARRCVPSIETAQPVIAEGPDRPVYRRTLDLRHGHATVALAPDDGFVAATLRLADVRDLTAAVSRCRRLLDLDADPVAVDERLEADPILAGVVAARPGLRSPASVDGFEMVVRAVLGQQVSVTSSLRAVARLVEAHGDPLTIADPVLTRVFPAPEVVAALDPTTLPMPQQRARALVAVSEAVAAGHVRLDPGVDRAEVRSALLRIAGIGPWTADYVAMRALGDPDVLAAGDLGVRQRAERIGIPSTDLVARSDRWSPWRTSVVHHLWALEEAA